LKFHCVFSDTRQNLAFAGNSVIYRTVDMGCVPVHYTIKSKKMGIGLGYSQTIFADATWDLIFILRSNNKVKLLDAKGRVLKWNRGHGCHYLTPFGTTFLPQLETDLAKVVGPWVIAIFNQQKLNTQLISQDKVFQIAMAITTFTTYVGHPCGEVHKPIVYPIPLTPKPEVTGSGYAGEGTGGRGSATVLPTSQQNTELAGYELGPWPAIPSGPTRTYTVFQPPVGQVLYHTYTSYAMTKDDYVKQLLAAGNYVTVVPVPEHDGDYTASLPSGGQGSVQTDPNVAKTAQAYQIKAQSYAWMTNTDFVKPAKSTESSGGSMGSGSYNSGGYY